MNYLADVRRAAHETALEAAEDRVRDGIARVLSEAVLSAAGTPSASTQQEQEEREASLARLDALERIHAVVESGRARGRRTELYRQYRSAVEQAAPQQDEAARGAGAEAAMEAAHVRTVAEFAADILAVRDAPAVAPAPAGGIRAELEAAAAAAAAAVEEGDEESSAFEASLQDLQGRIRQLAGAELAEGIAASAGRLLNEASVHATAAAEAAQDSLGPHREAVQRTRAWQARRRDALEQADQAVRERELPPMFGAMYQGRRRYPFGHQGRMVRLGDVPLSDRAGIAALVARALPPGDAHLAARVAAEVEAFMRDKGRHAFTQRLLEGGITVVVGGVQVEINLDLDMNQVHYLRAIETERTPVGQKRHHAVEADHQNTTGWRREIENERNVTVTANALTPFGALPHRAWQARAGASLTGTSSSKHTQGFDIVSATKRAPRFEGMTAYFEFLGASLRLTVTEAGPADRAYTLDLAARMAFPEEVAPLKAKGDPPGAFRPEPRKLRPDSKRYGFTQDQVDTDPSGTVKAAAERVEKIIHHVLSTPEWVGGGLAELREDVNVILDRLSRGPTTRAGTPRDPKVTETVERLLSEPAIMRNIADILGPGSVSPMVRDSSPPAAIWG